MSVALRLAVVGVGLVLAMVVVAVFSAAPGVESQRVSAFAATASAFAAITTAVVSAAALTQVKRDSRNAARPMVAADLRPARPASGEANSLVRSFQELVIRNYGASVASDVTITFEPELTATGGQSPALDELVELFSQPIPTLVPGPKLTSVYYDPVAPATPEQITVWISYTGPDGAKYGPESYPLDVRVARRRTYLEAGKRATGS